MKNIRLATNKDYPDDTSEWVEIDRNGVFFWKGEDAISIPGEDLGFSFPVDLEFVEKFFSDLGRELDVSRLPSNYVSNPYAVNL